MTDQEKFIKMAIALAREGMEAGHGGPFGSVVVKEGTVVGKSCNRVFETCDATAHAEVMAIRDACSHLGTADLSGCEIYSVGEPCPMCMAAIYWARIDRLYFANTKEQAAAVGFDDRFIYKELSQPQHLRSLPTAHCADADACDLFRDWNEQVDKRGLPQV